MLLTSCCHPNFFAFGVVCSNNGAGDIPDREDSLLSTDVVELIWRDMVPTDSPVLTYFGRADEQPAGEINQKPVYPQILLRVLPRAQ